MVNLKTTKALGITFPPSILCVMASWSNNQNRSPLCPLLAKSRHKVNAELIPQMPISLCPLLTLSGHCRIV